MATRSVLSACCDWGFLWVVNPTITVPDIFSFGGRDGSASAAVQTHRGYTIDTDTWSGRALALQAAAMGSTAIDGEGYSMGGLFNFPWQSVLSYAAQPDSWSSKTSLSTAKSGCEASTLGLFGILSGGVNGSGTRLTDVELYDSSGDSWASASAFSPKRYDHAAESYDSTTAYVFGGNNDGGSIDDLEDTDEYDKTGDSWTAKTDMSLAKIGVRAALLNGKIYTTTGRARETGAGDLKTLDQYDPPGDSWTAKTDAPSPERTSSSFSASGGDGYLHHGVITGTLSLTYLGDTDVYDPSGDSWTSVTTDSVSGGPRYSAGDFSL